MNDQIRDTVVRIVREHTQYEPERLRLDSHLEGELGVDSVMLASIVGSLRREFSLGDDRLKTTATTIRDLIEGVSATVQPASAYGHAPVQVNELDIEPPPVSVRSGPVLDAIRRHTHYAASLLAPTAHLEGELGIDSVVLTAIIGDLVREQGLPAGSVDARTIATVGDLVSQVEKARSKASRAAPAPAPAPRPVAAAPAPAPVAARPPAAAPPPAPRRVDPPKPVTATNGTRTNGNGNGTGTGHAHVPSVEETLAAVRATIQEKTGGAVDEHASLASLGVDLSRIHASVETKLGVPSTLRLSDCDTIAKLRTYIETVRPSTKSAPLPTPGAVVQRPPPAARWDGRSMKDFAEQRDRDLFAKVRSFNAFYRERKADHLYWYGMALETPCKNRAVIFDELTGQRREYLMFASNNYLGLANDPRVVDAIVDATRSYGATNTGCRLIGGTNVLHKELERRLAKFKGREACIVYPSGYSANVGCISALAKSHDAVIADKLNHMSILDGCKLSGASRKIYQHNDMQDLERVVERALETCDGALIVTDGVFSMHGNIVNLPEMVRVAKKFGAKVLVDDAHSTGVLGKRGSGTAEHFGLKSEVDLELGTMSKALAGLGGFVVGEGEVVEYLRFYSNSYVFAANIPAGVAAGLIAAIDVLEKEPERLTQLWTNINHLKQRLLAVGFDLGGTESAIIPIVVGDDRKTLEFGRAVRARGLFCQTVVYPGVSVGDARLRVSVSQEHTIEDLDLAADIFIDAARETGVLGEAR